MEIVERLGCYGDAADSIKLDYLQREKGRFKTVSTKGYEICLFLKRGKTLKENELLRSSCGYELVVAYAEESVMTATAKDWQQFCKVCYHMGNRHVRLQIGRLWIRFKPDHVLKELSENHGLSVKEHDAVFIPESGAYARNNHHTHTHNMAIT